MLTTDIMKLYASWYISWWDRGRWFTHRVKKAWPCLGLAGESLWLEVKS